jgi:hypothetical protein
LFVHGCAQDLFIFLFWCQTNYIRSPPTATGSAVAAEGFMNTAG